MFGPSSDDSSDDPYFRVLEKNCAFCALEFMVVPNVRLKPPMAVKKADMPFSRSARFDEARTSL